MGVGFDLSPATVLEGYRRGVFPWFSAGMPVLWWSPDPRTLLPLDGSLHVPRRLRRTLDQGRFEIRRDTAFEAVMRVCGEARPDGTWIHAAMREAYGALHTQGHAHSLEVWRPGPEGEERLVGGIYGVAFGACFAAESMFHRERDMSKVALVHLVEHLRARGFQALDVQFETDHLSQFGLLHVPRDTWRRTVRDLRDAPVTF